MNSRRKGKVGEREFASLLREHGFDARRGQQFCGGADSPDVVSDALRWLHIEVKRVQNLNLADACIQAQCDCGGKPWIVAHRRNHAPWFITMRAEFFFELIREFLPVNGATETNRTDATKVGGVSRNTDGDVPRYAAGRSVPSISAEDVCPQPTTTNSNPKTERPNENQ
jgi:hypothetical protein